MSKPNVRLAKKAKTWYIEFYATDPTTNKRRRFRRTFDLNRIKDRFEREQKAREIMAELPHKIQRGYPFKNVDKYIQWCTGLHYALEFKCRSDRYKTRVSYRSIAGIFEQYLKDRDLWHSKISDFTQVQAIQFLDDIELERAVSATTVNNYRMILRAIINELVRRDIVNQNPFSEIPKKKETQKARRSLTDFEKKVIIEYAVDHDRTLLLAIALVYYTFIRPVELRRLRVKHIDLQKGIITLPGAITKNRETSHLTIPDPLSEILMSYDLHTLDPDHYIFGAHLKPGKKQCGHHSISRRHLLACRVLKKKNIFKNTKGLQLYSWKDTGAIDFVNLGVPINDLMEHLRHKSLSTTQNYLQSFAEINKNIKEKAQRLI